VGSIVGVVVWGNALHRALLNVRTMAKDGTAMAVVDCPREMSEGATAVSQVKNQFFFKREREICTRLFWREKNIKFYFRTKHRTRKNSSAS
jgi:hypothetical protein